MKNSNWPAWYSSPDGKESAIFDNAEAVPADWTTGAEKAKPKRGNSDVSPAPADPALTNANPNAVSSAAEKADKQAASSGTEEFDAAGWPWSADLHASTKAKTKDGLWRMKVGVRRPAAKQLDL